MVKKSGLKIYGKYCFSAMIALGLLISGYLALKINLALSYHEVIWDEAVYIGIGKYIYSLGGTGIWESIRPPGLPILLGGVWKMNLPIVLFSEVIIILFGAVNMFLIYRITKYLSNERIALLAAIIFTLSPIFFYQSSAILTHIPAISFALIGIGLAIKEKWAYSGILIGVAFLFRYPQGIMLAAICAYILVNEYMRDNKNNRVSWRKYLKASSKKIILVLAGFLAILLPLLTLNFYLYNGEIFAPYIEAGKHQGNIVHEISDPVYNLFFYLAELIKQNPLLIFAVVGAYLFYKNWRKQKDNSQHGIMVIIAFLLPFLYYTIIINKQLRFSIEFLPYLSVLAAYGTYESCQRVKRGGKIFSGLFISAVVLLSLIPIKINLEQYRWRNGVESETTSQVYKYFFNNNITHPVLTSDPTLIAYSDIKVFTFYEDIPTALINYNKYHDKAAYILYNTEFYPCYNEQECRDRQLLFEVIKAENELILKKDNFYIFKNNRYE